MDIKKSLTFSLVIFALIVGANVWISPAISADDFELRLKRLERQLSNLQQTVADQEQKMFQQQASIQELRGNNEVLTHTLEQVRRRQQDIYSDLDKRLRQIQSYQPDAPQFSNPEGSPLKPSMPPNSISPIKNDALEPAIGDEEPVYQRALTLLRERQYAESITNFQEILNRYPEGKYADNAQYWIGEAYYALRKFDNALSAFNRLLNFYPNSAKRAHALLKIGYVYYEMRDYSAAKAILEQVRDTYQNTESAQLAVQYLEKIRAQGH